VPVRDQRRSHRYNLNLPFELVRTGRETSRQKGETRNVSSCGVLFTSEEEVPVGQSIEFIITLPTGGEGTPVKLRCLGHVVRIEPFEHTKSSVAATVERFEFMRA
jgi:hypothetical protein